MNGILIINNGNIMVNIIANIITYIYICIHNVGNPFISLTPFIVVAPTNMVNLLGLLNRRGAQ